MHQRWTNLGCRLKNTSKDSIDDESDYFQLHTDNGGVSRVVLTVTASDMDDEEAKVNTGYVMRKADNWYIKNPQSYAEAVLCCDTQGVEQNLSKKSELDYQKPVHDTEFHFPDQGTMAKLDFGKIVDSAGSVDDMISQLRLQSPPSASAAAVPLTLQPSTPPTMAALSPSPTS